MIILSHLFILVAGLTDIFGYIIGLSIGLKVSFGSSFGFSYQILFWSAILKY